MVGIFRGCRWPLGVCVPRGKPISDIANLFVVPSVVGVAVARDLKETTIELS